MAVILTREAHGAVLDWLVAELEVDKGELAHTLVYGRGSVRAHGYCHETRSGRRYFYVLPHTHKYWVDRCEIYPFSVGTSVWSPTTDWSQGGPIIEREGGTIWSTNADGWRCKAKYDHANDCEGPTTHGPTPLIAAMRCLVASKLGDEVEVPDKLLEN